MKAKTNAAAGLEGRSELVVSHVISIIAKLALFKDHLTGYKLFHNYLQKFTQKIVIERTVYPGFDILYTLLSFFAKLITQTMAAASHLAKARRQQVFDGVGSMVGETLNKVYIGIAESLELLKNLKGYVDVRVKEARPEAKDVLYAVGAALDKLIAANSNLMGRGSVSVTFQLWWSIIKIFWQLFGVTIPIYPGDIDVIVG